MTNFGADLIQRLAARGYRYQIHWFGARFIGRKPIARDLREGNPPCASLQTPYSVIAPFADRYPIVTNCP